MHDDELKRALAENGAFEEGKAAEMKQQATRSLDKAMKKVLWHSFIYLLLCVVVGLFAYHMLREATNTKAVIGFGILLLVAYESTVLIKLWYWIVNSKLSVLKEIKRMRLEVAALSSSPAPSPVADDLAEALPFQRTIGRKARWLYVVALVAVVFFVNGPLWTLARRDAMTLTSRDYVTLEADGSGSIVTELAYRHHGPMPLHQLDFYSGGPTSIRWMDRAGEEFEVETVHNGQNYRHTAALPRLVMPGDDVNYLRVMPAAATINDGVWTLSMDWSYGHRVNRYEETVKLPANAEVLSVEPEPVSQFTRGGPEPILRFEAERGAGEKFAYSIRYRLPEKI